MEIRSKIVFMIWTALLIIILQTSKETSSTVNASNATFDKAESTTTGTTESTAASVSTLSTITAATESTTSYSAEITANGTTLTSAGTGSTSKETKESTTVASADTPSNTSSELPLDYTGCKNITDVRSTEIDMCTVSLHTFNMSGVLTAEQGCRYYKHVLRCIQLESNSTCTLETLHSLIPGYLKEHGIHLELFEICRVNQIEEDYCSDSLAILTRGISVCGTLYHETKHHCDYIESVFTVQCYLTYGQADYFNCTTDQIRNATFEQSDWFQQNWNFNISSCRTGTSTTMPSDTSTTQTLVTTESKTTGTIESTTPRASALSTTTATTELITSGLTESTTVTNVTTVTSASTESTSTGTTESTTTGTSTTTPTGTSTTATTVSTESTTTGTTESTTPSASTLSTTTASTESTTSGTTVTSVSTESTSTGTTESTTTGTSTATPTGTSTTATTVSKESTTIGTTESTTPRASALSTTTATTESITFGSTEFTTSGTTVTFVSTESISTGTTESTKTETSITTPSVTSATATPVSTESPTTGTTESTTPSASTLSTTTASTESTTSGTTVTSVSTESTSTGTTERTTIWVSTVTPTGTSATATTVSTESTTTGTTESTTPSASTLSTTTATAKSTISGPTESTTGGITVTSVSTESTSIGTTENTTTGTSTATSSGNDNTTDIPMPVPTSILVPGGKTTTSTTVITPAQAPASNYTPGAEVYPFGQRSNDDYFSGDDRISPSIDIPIGFPSVNRFFDRVYIGTNGIISFSAARNFNPSVPVDFVKLAGVDFIAPFWTDLDARYYLSRVYYHVYDSRNIASNGDNVDTIIKMATKDVRYFYNENTFEAKWVLVVTWDKMTPPLRANENEVMTFQCVLITDGTSSFVIFRYIYMDWLLVRGRKAAIGYRLFEVKENDLSFDDAIFRVNHYRGNVGVKGFYIYKLTNEKAAAENSRKICYDWYDYYRKIESITHAASKVIDRRRYDCPCSLKSIWYDWRWLRVKSPIAGVSCYSLFAKKVLPNARTCCYNIFYGTYIRLQPSAGTFNLYHPIFAPRQYINEDLNPKEHCCYKTNLCSLFYSIRPIGSCYGSPPFAFRWFFGDPHIETLDGNQYTFNGLGEYWLMKYESENETFELQARTDIIVNKNGTYSNATIFSAFAAREANTTFQVELSTDRKQLIIYANGQDYTTQYNNNHDLMVIDTRIIMSRQNDTLVVIFGITGLQLNVTLGIRMLTFSTTVPEDFSAKTIGLVGNFDGNMDNDFILPNGTVLGKDETDAERKIFYNFGIHWTINAADSLFNYTKGKSADDYAHPEFIPVFIDEFREEDVNKSREICGGKSASTACIFDYLLTKDKNVGISSGRVDTEAAETLKASDNKLPEISGTVRVNATLGLPIEIHVNGSDDGNFTYDVISGPSSNFVFNQTENVYTWTPQDLSPIYISITAVDDSGLAAPPLEVDIVLCSNCSGHGGCLCNVTRETISPLYHYALCVCDVGWTGDHCESDIDGCAGLSCSEDRNCTDLSPTEENQFGRAFNCSPCPAGYSEVGQKCQDINECNETNICHQSCENTIGSYLCSCYGGYRLTGNLCTDINECNEGFHECEQECKNTNGNYSCSCVYGFELQNDGKSCTQVLNVCQINGLTCEYACDNNTVDATYRCICPTGQKIKSNGSTCEDLDECTLSICPQKCNNTDGSFACSCFDGYALELDKITCKPCEKRFWGPNCANECQCGIGGDRCDAARGCICLSGYTGENCDEDINECIVNPGICSINETCNNTYGSYICSCLPGYERNSDGNCKNTDECASEILNNCTTVISDCDDNVGSFTCKCKKGYNQLNPYACVDINECTSGSHSCEQLCDNVDGSYNCDCEIGFRLNNDRKSCEKDFEPCTNLNCSYGCKIEKGTAFCFCKDGYKLDTDGTSCIDINECSNDTLNSCNYKEGCENINGSYTCACPEGYFLENDGRTCSECDIFHWGPNCKYACDCGRGASHCDNINGCQCLAGWNGTTCASDINECDDNPCNGQNEDCVNTLGSYVCRCKTGYRNQSGICENIDECLENTHSCDQTCTDIDGTYNCSCNTGFMLYANGKCQDINECEMGEHKCDQRCDNTVGSYRCSCNEGYTLDNTNRNQCHGSSSETSSLSSTVETTTISVPLSTMYKMDTSSTFSTSFDGMERSSMPDFPSSVTLQSFQTDQFSTILASSSDDVIYSTSFPPTTSLERSTLFSSAEVVTSASAEEISLVGTSDVQTFTSILPTISMPSSTQANLTSTATPTMKTTDQALESTDSSQKISSILQSVTESDYITTQSTLKAESTVLSSSSSIGLDLSTSFSSTTTLESRSMETRSTAAFISSSVQTSFSESIASSSELPTSSSQIVTTTTPKPADEKIITYSVTYTLDINVAVSLTVQWSTAYNETFTKVHTSLTMFYSTQFGGSFKEVRLKSIRKGSLIAEHDLILKDEQQDNLIQVIADLLTDKIKLTYDNQETSVTSISYTYGQTEKTATTENITQAACEIYVSLKPCENDHSCQLIDGVPKCRVTPSQDNSFLAVVISVSVAVVLLLMIIVTMIVLLYMRNKMKTTRAPTSGPKRKKQLPKKFTRDWPNAADNRGYLGDSFERETHPYSYTTRVSREDNTYQRPRNAYSNIGEDLFNQWQDWFTTDDLSDFKIRRPHVDLLPEPKPNY